MTAVPPFSHSRAGELTLGTALGLLAAFPAGSTACVDGNLTERCVQGEGSCGPWWLHPRLPGIWLDPPSLLSSATKVAEMINNRGVPSLPKAAELQSPRRAEDTQQTLKPQDLP